MDTPTLVAVVVIAVVVLLVVLGLMAARKRRSTRLREEFGPEYDRTLDDAGKRRAAEKELAARKEEHDQLELRPLTPAARERYTASWTATQAKFVDAPAQALTEADGLLTQLMVERGYPVEDFETRTRLLSVGHGRVMDDYRSAHQVELASRARTADTESVRNAMLDFRRVFEDLMQVDDDPYPADTPAQRESRTTG